MYASSPKSHYQVVKHEVERANEPAPRVAVVAVALRLAERREKREDALRAREVALFRGEATLQPRAASLDREWVAENAPHHDRATQLILSPGALDLFRLVKRRDHHRAEVLRGGERRRLL